MAEKESKTELLLASQIAETTRTDGWKTIRTILEENIVSLDTLEGVTNMKEVEARRLSSRALKKFLSDIDAIVTAAHLGHDMPKPSERALFHGMQKV
jgi:hypothetical protein